VFLQTFFSILYIKFISSQNRSGSRTMKQQDCLLI